MLTQARDAQNNIETLALSPLGERVDRDGAFTSRRGPGEGSLAQHEVLLRYRALGKQQLAIILKGTL